MVKGSENTNVHVGYTGELVKRQENRCAEIIQSKAGFGGRFVFKLENTAYTLAAPFTMLFDLAVGAITTPFDFLTGRHFDWLHGQAEKLGAARYLLVIPFRFVVYWLNGTEDCKPSNVCESDKDQFLKPIRVQSGSSSTYLKFYVEKRLAVLASSDHFMTKHVGTRLATVVAYVALLATRIIDLVLGGVFLSLGLLLLGQSNNLNVLAYDNLQPGVVIDDAVRAVGDFIFLPRNRKDPQE